MTRIILSGCSGAMGRVVTACAANNEGCQIVAGIDAKSGQGLLPYPVLQSPEKVEEEADVLIDFSNPTLLPSLLDFGKQRKMPLVLCTTGYNKEQDEEIRKAAELIPIFHSGNMSFGINLLIELAKRAAKALGGFDIEIIEKHHNQKIDAPSGTALMIADGITSALNMKTNYVYDRHSQRKKRETNEIGIHSIRGGTIVGEHEVIFAGPQEVITLSHSAQSKDIFALGAIHAAEFLACKANGLYTMSDLLN